MIVAILIEIWKLINAFINFILPVILPIVSFLLTTIHNYIKIILQIIKESTLVGKSLVGLITIIASMIVSKIKNLRRFLCKIKNIHFIKIQKTNNNNDDIYFSFEVENNSDFDLTINDIYIFYKKQNLYIKLIDFYLRNNHVYSNKTIKPKNKSEIECRINFILQKGSLKFENLEKSVHYNSYKITIPDIKSIDKYLRYKPYKIIIKNSLYDKKIRITRKQWKRFKKEILEYIEKFNIK